MLAEDRSILDQFAKKLVPELQAVSGRHFGSSIAYYFDEDSLTIDASPFIQVLIDGRGPTKNRAGGIGQSLQQRLLVWIREKNIVAKSIEGRKTISQEQLSWAMSKTIHKFGTALYRRGGGNNIFDAIITQQRIDALITLFANTYQARLESQIYLSAIFDA